MIQLIVDYGCMGKFDFNAWKDVRVPFWARLLGAYRARQRRKAAAQEAHYVATLIQWARITDTKSYTKCFYILKEYGDGRRFYTFQPEMPHLEYLKTRTWVYAHVVEPWRLGSVSNQQVINWAAEQKAAEQKAPEQSQ